MRESSRFQKASVLILLTPVSAGLGSWLIFQGQILPGPAPISNTAIVETGVGILLVALALPLFFSSLGVFASRNDEEADRWLRWLGRLKPTLHSGSPSLKHSDTNRRPVLAILLVILIQAILLIPGIGEDRKFPPNQFYGLFSSLWYFYVLGILFGSLALIYYQRPGGYILAIILSLLSIGTTLPDVLGFLPPSAPTVRTTILEMSIIPLDVLLAFVCWKNIHTGVSE